MRAYHRYIYSVITLCMFVHSVHGCGLAMVRLLKPLFYYTQKYGTPAWGLHAVCSLMEEQRNRGQDGAGLVVLKKDMQPGQQYQRRIRFAGQHAIDQLCAHVFKDLCQLDAQADDDTCKQQSRFLGEMYLGHVRYGTYGENAIGQCQPYRIKHTVASKRFALAGNFNMTNTKALFDDLICRGYALNKQADTFVMLEQIRCQLEREHDFLMAEVMARSTDRLTGQELMKAVSEEVDMVRVLRAAAKKWDGGYVFGGMLGNGDMFVCRDPAGIRPGFYYMNDEVFAAASERAALCSVFDIEPDQVLPIPHGHVLALKANGRFEQAPFTRLLPEKQCSFEHIYFSRAHDIAFYNERKQLGAQLAERVLNAIDWDLAHAVFTYIPNSSESAFIGLVAQAEQLARERKMREVWQKCQAHTITLEDVMQDLNVRVRADTIVFKNQKLRTFISEGSTRSNLIARLYDITKGSVAPTDTLVAIDDSIVRGMTLKHSILTQLIRLNPKRIIIVSSAPPVLYPDCYGIDISSLERFIGFQAAVALTKERGNEQLLKTIEQACYEQEKLDPAQMRNCLQALYDQFSLQELEDKVAALVAAEHPAWHGRISIIYQPLEGLRNVMPASCGDWYFSGEYPTPGGYAVLNKSVINWVEGKQQRAY